MLPIVVQISRSVDSFVVLASSCFPVTFSNTGFGLIVKLMSTGVANELSLSNRVLYEVNMNKHET